MVEKSNAQFEVHSNESACRKKVRLGLEQVLDNQKIENCITPFVINMVFQHVGLFWIIQSNQKLNFDFQHKFHYCILNLPWYNTTICSLLYGLSFEYYVTTAIHDRYNLMCSIEDHDREHPAIIDD